MVGRQRQRQRRCGRPSTTEDDVSLSWVGDCLVARAVSRETLISDSAIASQSRRRHLHAPRRPELKRTAATMVAHKKKERCFSSMAEAATATEAAGQHQQLNWELSQLRERAAILSMAAAKASSLPHLLDLEEGEISPTASQKFHLEELRRLTLRAMRLRGRQPLEPSNNPAPTEAPLTSSTSLPTPTVAVDMMPHVDVAEVPHHTSHLPAEAIDPHWSTLLRRLASLSMSDCAAQDSIFDGRFLHSLQALTI